MSKFCQSNWFGQIKLNRESYNSLEHSAQSSSHLASKQSGKPMSISYSTHVLLGYLSEIYFDKFRFYGVFLLSSKEKTYIFEVEYNNISVLPFIQDCIFS